MRFLTDQDVYKSTVDFLKEHGFDVVTAKDVGLSEASDENILIYSRENNLVLITRDKDFGSLVFFHKHDTSGVILLRIDPVTIKSTHEELLNFLTKHKDLNMNNRFCVIEAGCHRIR